MFDDLFEGAGEAVPPAASPVECPPPGIYRSIPAHVYHQWPAVSSTLLKGYAALPSTAHIPYEAQDDANVGQGIHSFTLQGKEVFDAECFILPPECEGKSKKALEERAHYAAMHPSKALLPHRYGPGAAETKPPVMDVIMGVDTSYRTHPKTRQLFDGAETEVSLVWIDPDSGCICKARIDLLKPPFFFDLKKTRKFDGFQWQIRDLFYGVQLGHYMNGCIANGINIVSAGFLPCEAVAPYRVGCGYREPDKLDADRTEAARLVGLVKQSQMSGYWPNFQIPPHIFNLNDIQPDDLVTIY